MTSRTEGGSAAGASLASSVLVSDDQRDVVGKAPKAKPPKEPGQARKLAWLFLAPALIMLAAVLIYPLIYSIIRSLFADGPAGTAGSFVGLRNYGSVFTDSATLRAVKNNVLWIVIVPTVITIVGLIFAVLTERVRWGSAFKLILFMPMAISFLASGITFSMIYVDQPSQGLANAVWVGVHDTLFGSGKYPDEHSLPTSGVTGSASKGYTTSKSYSPGTPALVPMVGLSLTSPPSGLAQAQAPSSGAGLSGVVWNDFALGGAGKPGQVDKGELGLSGMKVEAVQNGKVVASTTADADGQFSFPELKSGSYQVTLPASNFAAAYAGESWLGPTFITPMIMLAYLWAYAGFAMVLLAAGMSAIPRDALEAARIDGATEWQVFRRVTAPLLAPVLLVVFVTLVINVLKIFDIVYVMQQSAGGNAKYADVLATQLFTAYGQQKYGVASAIGVILVIAVLPFIVLNIRRFKRDQQ